MLKIAGIESIANIRSVTPIVTKTAVMGVQTRLPSMTVRSFGPSKSSLTRTSRRTRRTAKPSFAAVSSSCSFSGIA